MKQYNSYWEIWQTADGAIARRRVQEVLTVESSREESRLTTSKGVISAHGFFQDEEGGYYDFLGPFEEQFGENVGMWIDLERNYIYVTHATVDILVENMVFTKLNNLRGPERS
jgi:hypothetical protein